MAEVEKTSCKTYWDRWRTSAARLAAHCSQERRAAKPRIGWACQFRLGWRFDSVQGCRAIFYIATLRPRGKTPGVTEFEHDSMEARTGRSPGHLTDSSPSRATMLASIGRLVVERPAWKPIYFLSGSRTFGWWRTSPHEIRGTNGESDKIPDKTGEEESERGIRGTFQPPLLEFKGESSPVYI